MIRYICTAYIRLSVVLICLMSTACGGTSVTITPSPIPTESPPLTLTLDPEGPSSKIDRILTFHTEEETFTGAVLVARNGKF